MTVVSTKGGVGKTTLTANLGGILADLGQRVVDGDMQPTLSSYYRLTNRAPRGLVEILENGEVAESISRTDSGCDIVVSNDPEALPDWGSIRLIGGSASSASSGASRAMTLS